MSTDDVTLGQVAYAAYGRTTNNLNYQGLPMPAWDALGDTIREAWENAAKAIQGATVSPPILAAAESRAAYSGVWAELTGYVEQAAEDHDRIDPNDLLPYMRELQRKALAPVREWMASLGNTGTEEAAR